MTRHSTILLAAAFAVLASSASAQGPSSPARQPMNEFRSTKISADELVFEDAEHDFPQKITYRRLGADSLFARVEGDRAGRMQPIDYPFKRTACD